MGIGKHSLVFHIQVQHVRAACSSQRCLHAPMMFRGLGFPGNAPRRSIRAAMFTLQQLHYSVGCDAVLFEMTLHSHNMRMVNAREYSGLRSGNS